VDMAARQEHQTASVPDGRWAPSLPRITLAAARRVPVIAPERMACRRSLTP
jgi:hypothetical protein